MAYLIFSQGSEVLKAKRHALQEPSYSVMRSELEKLYPGSVVASPLEPAPEHSIMVCAYVSKDKNGVGRSGSSIYRWAVEIC